MNGNKPLMLRWRVAVCPKRFSSSDLQKHIKRRTVKNKMTWLIRQCYTCQVIHNPYVTAWVRFICHLKAWKIGCCRITMRMSETDVGFTSVIAEVMPSSMALHALTKSIPPTPDGIWNNGNESLHQVYSTSDSIHIATVNFCMFLFTVLTLNAIICIVYIYKIIYYE